MDNYKQPTYLVSALVEQGYRITLPRKAITGLLVQKHSGFTIEALSEELPLVSRATVYRTVKLLIEVGLVCKLATMDGSSVYSVTRAGHHHHYVCVRCGAVEEFRADSVERMVRSIGADLPGQIVDHRIELYVDCDRCPAQEAG